MRARPPACAEPCALLPSAESKLSSPPEGAAAGSGAACRGARNAGVLAAAESPDVAASSRGKRSCASSASPEPWTGFSPGFSAGPGFSASCGSAANGDRSAALRLPSENLGSAQGMPY